NFNNPAILSVINEIKTGVTGPSSADLAKAKSFLKQKPLTIQQLRQRVLDEREAKRAKKRKQAEMKAAESIKIEPFSPLKPTTNFDNPVFRDKDASFVTTTTTI